jgi:UDP:flavonoid glycosyltransferase YjiC (YdhE family)
MATVLLACAPLRGHLDPVLGVAGGLITDGHQVIVATGSRFASRVESAGAEFAALTGRADYDERDVDAYLPDLHRYRGVALSQYQLQHTFIHPLHDQWVTLKALIDSVEPDIVMTDHLFAGVTPLLTLPAPERMPVVGLGIGPLAQLSIDTAPPGMALQPSSTPIGRIRNRLLNAVATRVAFRDTQRLARRLFADATGRPLPPDFPFILDLTAQFDRFLQLGPREFEYPISDLSPGVRFVGRPAGATPSIPTPPWWDDLADGRPIVHVTQGTLANADTSTLLRPAIEALGTLDMHVLVSTGGTSVAALGPLPANVKAAEFLPYDQLLPRAAAVVSNGGYGTVLAALAHGVPVVVAPGAEDKPEVAARVRYFDVGIDLRTNRPAAAELRRAVVDVLGDARYHTNASAIAAAMAQARPHEAVRQEVDRLLARTRP